MNIETLKKKLKKKIKESEETLEQNYRLTYENIINLNYKGFSEEEDIEEANFDAGVISGYKEVLKMLEE